MGWDRDAAVRERVWRLETGSSTHNEFRWAARPLSGDSGRLDALLINTRAGSKSATGDRDDFQTRISVLTGQSVSCDVAGET